MRYTATMRFPPLTRRQALVTIAAAAAAPLALAEPPPPPAGSARYHIELIVFRQPGELPAPQPPEPLTGGGTLAGRVTPVPDSEWQLGSVASSLGQRGFRIVTHTAFYSIVPPNGRTTAHLEDLLPPDTPLSGSIAVQRGQYLYLGVELDYRPPAAPEQTAPLYTMREKRRIKFGERHYFDNPAFGAIVWIAVPHALPPSG
jgi:Peptidoglycan-binding protein, CsiV